MLEVSPADFALAPAVIVLYIGDHTLFSPVVSIRIYHCINCLKVFILIRDQRRRRSLCIPRLGLCIFLEAVRLAVVIIVFIFNREKLFRGITMLCLICSLSWEVHLGLELRIDENFGFRVDVVLVVGRRVGSAPILHTQRS